MARDLQRIEVRLKLENREPTMDEAATVASYARNAASIKQARIRPGSGAYARWGNKTVAQLMEEMREDPELMRELADALGGAR
jgi:hypothetical protein